MKNKVGLIFIVIALLSLAGGVLFGTIGALQFIYPGFLDSLPFFKIRPLHVSLVVAWIFFAAVGGIYYYLPRFAGLEWKSKRLQVIHLILFIITGITIIGCYFAGKFGGREYWEFPPWLAIPIIISWLLFGLNYFSTVFSKKGKWPVYMWMWASGIFFFLFTFLESYLWVFPFFRDNIVRDVTMQWKAYGALTGSWNMLVYGTAIFVMERIKGDDNIAYSRLSFLMYFLGLANLMFGWAHHIYIVPSAPWIRYLAYAISMTELIILARIIWGWARSLGKGKRELHFLPYRFIVASDVWIFLNLVVAILISVPAINIYTHGTHITVAHAMGSTIGINTMILLASCFYILWDAGGRKEHTTSPTIRIGYWLINISLAVFWISLILAGSYKGYLLVEEKLQFAAVMEEISSYLQLFAWAGAGILAGIILVVTPLVRGMLANITRKTP